MKFRLSSFSIFLILLILLVLIMLFMNWQLFKKNKESFVNFQNNNPSTYGSMVYIPQYTSDSTYKVISLYDNLYFDHKNGNLIEVNSSSCAPNSPATSCTDNTGISISEIYIVPRNGESVTIYPSSTVNPDEIGRAHV